MAPRALSPVEHAFWLLDRGTSFNGVNTSFLRGPIKAAEVRRALGWVMARHEILRLGIVAEPPAFVALDGEVPLRVVKRDSADTWQACEKEEINTRYLENQLLWRAVWVEGDGGGELLISHQHVICDAQSAVLMARDFVNALGAMVAGIDPPVPRPLALRPSLTELLRLGAWRRFYAMNHFVFRNLLFHGLRPARKLVLGRRAPAAERTLGIVHLWLDERETARLAARCKEEQTTVQGGLCAAMLIAAAGLLGLDAPAWLASFSAIGLHDRLGIQDDMGLFVSQVTTYHRVARATELWPLARELKRDLIKTLDAGEQFVTIPMIGMFIPRGRDPAPRFAKKFDLASPATVGLSNIGRIELPRAVGPVALERFHLAVGPSVVSPLAACAATLHGRLAMNLVHVEPLISAAECQELADATLRILRA